MSDEPLTDSRDGLVPHEEELAIELAEAREVIRAARTALSCASRGALKDRAVQGALKILAEARK